METTKHDDDHALRNDARRSAGARMATPADARGQGARARQHAVRAAARAPITGGGREATLNLVDPWGTGTVAQRYARLGWTEGDL